MSILDGIKINRVEEKSYGYNLHVTGGVISVTETEDISSVNEALETAREYNEKGLEVDEMDYLRYYLINEKGW